MSKFTHLISRNQIADNAITEVELSVVLQGKVTQISTNSTAIATIINSKAAANGIATLGADGKLPSSQIPAIAVSDFLGEKGSEAEMLAAIGQRGDWIVRTDESKSYMLVGDDASVVGNWKEIVSPTDGVTAIRNASGTQTGLNGVVTLADVAMSGQSADVAFANAAFTATNVSTALVEVKTITATNADDIDSLETAMEGKIGVSGVHPYVELTGTIDGVNKTFTSSVTLTGAKVGAYLAGQLMHPTDYSISGNDVTFTGSPDHEHQRPALMVVKAA